MTDAFGAITWWGFSPALDLQDDDFNDALKKMQLAESKKKELNVLLIGAGDLRHVLWTIAKAYKHKKRKLNFYILENNLELYARNILLLTVALEKQTRMGLQEKTELFLELYGNILVRKQSEEYVVKMATEFIKMVTDEEYLMKKLPYIDLSQLKFKERDFLEGIFKFWRNREVIGVFEVSNYWDLRQRKLLGVRYDSRTNVYDWDYQMRLAQRDADIINTHEYKYWRNNGIAFEIREGDYDVPNKTLASGLILTHDGEKHARRGYWGDIIVSPYIALGIECEEKAFFKKSNNVFTKTASHVAEYNVMSMFYEITTKTKYKFLDGMEKPLQKPQVPQIIELDESDDQSDADSYRIEFVDIPEPKTIFEQEYEPLPLDGVNITFLPVGSLLDICKKSKYKKLFQVFFFSNSMVHLLQPDINPMFDDKATVIIESARYMIELKLEQVTMFVDKVQGIARTAGCTSVEDIDPEKTNFVKMLFERKETST